MSGLQVVSWKPGMTTPRYLGQYGHVSALQYSYACPGGCDQLTCTLWQDARFRADGMNPGRIVQVLAGAGTVIWEGVMLEPAPGTSGWTITAVGNGSWGTNYRAVYSVPAMGWSFAPSGTPGSGNYFTATPAEIETITVGQVFTDTLNAGTAFLVTGISGNDVFFTPTAGTLMGATDTVTLTAGAWDYNSHFIDDQINAAIARGLRWVNPGVGSSLSTGWLGQEVDTGAQTITDLLNLVCSNGGYTWYVGRGNQLRIIALGPTGLPSSPVAFRQMINPNPVARTLGGNLNSLYLRYQATTDAGTTPASYGLANAVDLASVAMYGTPMEDYVDLSSAGLQTEAEAVAIGNFILQRYLRATYAGPFVIRQGQLLSEGGQPVDIALEQAGTVVRMLLTDYTYGAEESPAPVSFFVGGYAYDDDSQTAQVTPFQNLNASEQSILVEPWITAPPGLAGAGGHGGIRWRPAGRIRPMPRIMPGQRPGGLLRLTP